MTGLRGSRSEPDSRIETGDARKRQSASGADLRARATLAGLSWAETWFERARREQRCVEGGWPGTMSEARAQLRGVLIPSLSKHVDDAAPPAADFEATARVLYSTAREAWRERVARGRRRSRAGTPRAAASGVAGTGKESPGKAPVAHSLHRDGIRRNGHG